MKIMMLFSTMLTNTRPINYAELASSIPHAQKVHFQESYLTSIYKNPWLFPSLPIVEKSQFKAKRHCTKVAIIGGGLCGVTAAKALAKKVPLSGPGRYCDITVFEADPMSLSGGSHAEGENVNDNKRKIWKAAAARNANSLVPGAAMHIMSQREVIYRIIKDYVGVRPVVVYNKCPKEDFSGIPQYFGLDVLACVGWSVPWEEKMSFFRFMYHFLKTSIFDNKQGVKTRGEYLVQLANANRKVLQEDELYQKLNHQSGFISVHRTVKEAEGALKELEAFKEDGEIISKETAEELEPRLKMIPFRPSFFVHRKNDSAANCHSYLVSSIKSLMKKGVKYENNFGKVTQIRANDETNDCEGRFTISTSTGNEMKFDYVIVANGIYSPTLISTINARVGFACPIYPLRGYSLTLTAIDSRRKRKPTFLNKAMSFDNIYCTSVDPDTVRMAGFGEITGWPRSSNDYLNGSVVSKYVLEKYGKALFQTDMVVDAEDVLPCYRPMSPDDLPIVGEVDAIKGLYLHTGHSTLGWTLCSATAECLAQSVYDDINDIKYEDSFILPDGTKIKKSILSPNRFIWHPPLLLDRRRT